ncbi:MAG: hypothetical protein ACRCX8_07740 [Sarcina sp.]
MKVHEYLTSKLVADTSDSNILKMLQNGWISGMKQDLLDKFEKDNNTIVDVLNIIPSGCIDKRKHYASMSDLLDEDMMGFIYVVLKGGKCTNDKH